MRPQDDIDAEKNDERMLDQLAKKGRAASDFVAAVRTARTVCAEAGLDATFDDHGRPVFTAEQTAKAIRHAREDVSASLAMQLLIMRRLDRNRNFMWAIIALLLYIAGQFK
jgi:hypothetical protein